VKRISAGRQLRRIFESNIGENTPIGLARGLNAQWTDGGLLYSPPFR
jgi:general L-amino acid transport system substrate-binding protein